MSATQIKKVRAWHEELLEFMLAHPRASLQETAFYFNVSVSWVSIIKNTDAFRELWAARRGEHFSRVSVGVSERLTALAEVTVDALTEKVEEEVRAGTVKIDTLKEVSDMALKSLGFGPKGNVSGPVTNVQNNFLIDRETLARARASRQRLQQSENAQKLLEAEVVELPSETKV